MVWERGIKGEMMVNLSVIFEVVKGNVATGKQVNVSDLDFLKAFDRIGINDWLDREDVMMGGDF